jgi:hypothetical protein
MSIAKRIVLFGILLFVVGMALWFGSYPIDWENWLGFSQYDYFKAGTNYAFASGPGPMLLTAVGMSTIITGLWHAHNCHQDGCWRIGKHKVNGTPWCNVHHEQARAERSMEVMMDELITEIRGLRSDLAGK